jgi:hypothetical protein
MSMIHNALDETFRHVTMCHHERHGSRGLKEGLETAYSVLTRQRLGRPGGASGMPVSVSRRERGLS